MTIKQYYTNLLCKQGGNGSEPVVVTSMAELAALTNNTSQCLLLDLVLNRTLGYEEVIELAKQKITTGGVLLVMLGSIAPGLDGAESFWGFTLASANYIFGKHFAKEDFEVYVYGNVLVGRILLTGGTVADLEQKELDYSDAYYPVYVGVKAIKR